MVAATSCRWYGGRTARCRGVLFRGTGGCHAGSADVEHDKDALVSALAAQGCRELHDCLAAAAPADATPDDFAALAVAYVRFALAHPALFRIMFRTSCTPADTERDAAAADVDAFVRRAAAHARPDADPDTLGVACWALLHGLAFLYLEGKLPTDPPAAVDARVRTSVGALIDA